MKKIYATLFALLALSLVSCSDSSDPIVPDPEPTPTPTPTPTPEPAPGPRLANQLWRCNAARILMGFL